MFDAGDLAKRAATRIAADPAACARVTQLAIAFASGEPARVGETTHPELAALRDIVYDALEKHGAPLTPSEARRIADWFQACRDGLFTRNEARFAVALRHSEVVVFESDVEGKLTWLFNSQIEKRVGSMVGRRLNEFMTLEESTALDAAENRVMTTNQRESIVSRVTIGTDTVDMLQSFEALHDESGTVIGLTGTAINITEATRTREKLSQAVAFQEQMIGVLGHDLMNPVSAVQSLAQLLLEDPFVVAVAGPSLARVAQASRRMAELIRVIVDFTRTRIHGSLPISRSPMDLGELCTEIVDELRVAHPSRQIELEARGDLRGAWDYARMGQVISNLVGNALTHGDRTAPVKLIATGEEPTVTLAIINRGPMISTDGTGRLFEPFAQGDGAVAKQTGLGLGLYIVKQIVIAHGGSITAASDTDHTTFTMCLARR